MYFEFFHNLYQKLLENEFKLIKNFYDNESITENSLYIGLYKQIGPIAYFILIVNADNANKSDKENEKYENLYKNFKEYINNIYKEINIEKVVSLNVIFAENVSDELKNFSLQEDILYDAEILNLIWLVELSTSKLIVMGEQPDKIIDIEKYIKDSLNIEIDNKLENDKNISVYDVIDDIHKKEQTYIKSNNNFFTFIILIINFLVFAVMELNGGSTNINILIKFGAIEPDKILFEHQYYRLFTAMFIHIGLTHLLANSLSLYIFGTRIEKYFGKNLFLVIYLISGIAASTSSLIFSRNVGAGASGAIFGLVGATLAYSRIKSKSLDGFDLYFIILFAIVAISGGFMSFNVDNSAHIGGFITGYLLTYIINKFKRIWINI